MAGINSPYRYQYERVAASQTAQVLGGTGAVGDYVHRLIVTVNTSATSTVSLIDGAGTGLLTYPIMPTNTPIGVYSIQIEAASQNGSWKLTTGAGVDAMAVGVFSA